MDGFKTDPFNYHPIILTFAGGRLWSERVVPGIALYLCTVIKLYIYSRGSNLNLYIKYGLQLDHYYLDLDREDQFNIF